MVVFHSSYVQNKIIGMATEALSKELQTEIQIEHVGLNLLGQRVSIKGVRLKDQHKRELLLVKVPNHPETRSEIMAAADVYRGKIIDYSVDAMVIEVTGEPLKIQAFIDVVKPIGIIEMCRTGVVSLERGATVLHTQN